MRLKTKTLYLNLDELAAKIGRKPDTIRRVLNRQKRPSVWLAERLKEQGISPGRFLKPRREGRA